MRASDAYRERLRSDAEDLAFKRELERIKARRQHEKYMRERGSGRPFDDLVLQDVETLKKDHPLRFELLADEDGFLERVRLLESEAAGAVQRAREAGAAAALSELPAEVELKDRHEGELALFLQQHRVEDITAAPPAVQAAYHELVERHEREVNRTRSLRPDDRSGT